LLNKSINELASNIDKAGVKFRLIEQEKISDINSKLSNFSASDQVSALTSREGEVYELLKERGMLLKKNYENRENLAKLILLVSNIVDLDLRYKLVEAIEKGSIKEGISLSSYENSKKLIRFFNRVGIPASLSEDKTLCSSPSTLKEIPFVISNKKVWVAAEAADRLSQNLSNLEKISPQLQWKNAQRQIKELTEEEEKEFMDLQRKYLDLLKEQDEILKDFNEEEKLTVKVS